MQLRGLNFSFCELRYILHSNHDANDVYSIIVVYLSLYEPIFQYGLLVQRGLVDNVIHPLKIQ